MSFTQVIARRFEGPIEHLRQNLAQIVRELQEAHPRTFYGVELADATETPLNHGMGQRVHLAISPPRGATSTGRIEEVRNGAHDLSRTAILKATGWGATITVDVRVSREP